MIAPLQALREGRFVTRERARLWSVAFLVGYALALVGLAATAHGASDYHGRPLGTDFSSFYSAGRLALAGHAAAPFDSTRLHHMQQTLFGAHTPFYAFAYPPVFLLMVTPLAALPYMPALLLWQGATLLFYLFALALLLRRVGGIDLAKDRTALLLVLAFPAVFVNLIHGQNAFLTAALFSLALAFLNDRPILAGVFFGLLIYKPQFGLMIPLALAASGRWRTIAAAAATVLVLMLLATALFGRDIWHAFFLSMTFANHVILDLGAVGYEKMQSAFAAVRLLGGGVGPAYAVQGAVSLATAAALIKLWHSRESPQRKAAGLCLASLLATPFCLDYDFVLMAPAIALMAAEARTCGPLSYEKSLLAALWLAPAVARAVAGTIAVPLGMPVLALGLFATLRSALRAWQTQANSSPNSRGTEAEPAPARPSAPLTGEAVADF